MQALFGVMEELAAFNTIKDMSTKEKGMLQVVGATTSMRSHIIKALDSGVKRRIILVSNELKAKQIYEEYTLLDPQVQQYPAKDLLFYHADIKGNTLQQKRMEVMKHMIESEESTVILGLDALMDKLPTMETIKAHIIDIHTGDKIDLDAIKLSLVNLGYGREEQVAGVGQFAVRGGILDIFPLTEAAPIRVELWGDEVDSIRRFDVDSQRSMENLEKIKIYPASEHLIASSEPLTAVTLSHHDGPSTNTHSREEGPSLLPTTCSFLDYFNPEETLIFLDEPTRLMEAGTLVEEEFVKSTEKRLEQGMDTAPVIDVIYYASEIIRKLNKYSGIGFTSLPQKCGDFLVRDTFYIEGKRINAYNNSFEALTRDLKRLKREQYRVVLLSGSRSRAKRLAEDLRDYDLSSYYQETLDEPVSSGEILVTYGYVTQGYEYHDVKFMVISEGDIFGREKRNKKRKVYEGQKIQSFTELKVGDYVVHENHGLGVYQGIETIQRDKISKDYMKISYAGTGNLYIPATQLNLIQKYANADAKKPKLSRLGGKEWGKTKARVKGVVKDMAKDLVALYSARQQKEGYVYGPDTVWQREFEEMFPYEETEDQLLAIESTKEDMESTKIMDRLICGDVGYGKTEIAIRAAFKAVQESKQIVYLVPTTILAQQHYNNFVQRMKDFPVRIDLMCRFRTAAQQKETIQDTKKGEVDILIGTHRLLSKDMEYKNLGLLIVDEEQRFGVQHKESIKKLKENVDVLTLTATPIPRTLHMSLIGIRDMSILEEAPQERMPIQTYVMEYNDEMVREAIERELARDGQVYYVYNKVHDIAEITNRISMLVPDARVSFAHGQMKEQELESIMYDFINGDIDVLVSTTIIETGLDISNANTMIIHDSDQLGLSQLYQLRGRVGRSNRMAYAFLLYRRDKMLKEVAEKRLTAIREFTDLGSGFKIAMRDLEIRGAGNLLGGEQHGHMEAVGYDLFCKMLNEAVKLEKGEITEETFETAIDIHVDAHIPPTYIPNELQKLDVYKRIASIENEDEMSDMLEELIDRYGDVPIQVQKLLQVALLRTQAHSAYVTTVEQKGDKIKFIMFPKAPIDGSKILNLLEAYGGDLIFRPDEAPYFQYEKQKRNYRDKTDSTMDTVKEMLENIKKLMV